MKRFLLPLLLLPSCAHLAPAQSTIFLVRHAEKSAGGAGDAKDPELSAPGKARAQALAKMLQEAAITAIYATESKRTQETAAPLAKIAGVQVTIVPARETPSLVATLKAARGNALVVGHSNTVPEILQALGLTTPLTIAENDYSNLFIADLSGDPRVIRLHYR